MWANKNNRRIGEHATAALITILTRSGMKLSHRRALSTYLFVVLTAISTHLSFTNLAIADSNEKVLRWCLDHYPSRHIFTATGIEGPSVDLVEELAKRAQLNIMTSDNIPFARCLKYIKEGKMDFVVGLYKTPERETFMHLFPMYSGLAESLFFDLRQNIEIPSLAALSSKKIGLVENKPIHSPDFSTIEANNTLVPFKDTDSALAALHTGDIDLLLGYHSVTLARIEHNPRYKSSIAVSPLKLAKDTETFIYFGLSKNSGLDKSVISKVETTLRELMESGELEAIMFPDGSE